MSKCSPQVSQRYSYVGIAGASLESRGLRGEEIEDPRARSGAAGPVLDRRLYSPRSRDTSRPEPRPELVWRDQSHTMAP